jgi:hypothetical protein
MKTVQPAAVKNYGNSTKFTDRSHYPAILGMYLKIQSRDLSRHLYTPIGKCINNGTMYLTLKRKEADTFHNMDETCVLSEISQT